MATPQSLADAFNGVTNGQPDSWRIVHLLREALVGDLSTTTDGTQEGPNTSTSVFDHVTTLAKILTRRYKGKDVFDMIAEIHDAVVK